MLFGIEKLVRQVVRASGAVCHINQVGRSLLQDLVVPVVELHVEVQHKPEHIFFRIRERGDRVFVHCPYCHIEQVGAVGLHRVAQAVDEFGHAVVRERSIPAECRYREGSFSGRPCRRTFLHCARRGRLPSDSWPDCG